MGMSQKRPELLLPCVQKRLSWRKAPGSKSPWAGGAVVARGSVDCRDSLPAQDRRYAQEAALKCPGPFLTEGLWLAVGVCAVYVV